MGNEQSVSLPKPSIGRAVLLGTLLVVIDAFFLNQGAIALLVGLWMLLVGLSRTFVAKKYATVRAARLRNIAVYFVAVILVFVFNALNNHLAQSRANALISAVKAFHGKNQRYPRSLEELVPDYVERVPLAKYTLMVNKFWYYTSDQDASLFYVDFPPFGRPTYSFRRDAWDYLD
jgi:hypothetical protein